MLIHLWNHNLLNEMAAQWEIKRGKTGGGGWVRVNESFFWSDFFLVWLQQQHQQPLTTVLNGKNHNSLSNTIYFIQYTYIYISFAISLCQFLVYYATHIAHSQHSCCPLHFLRVHSHLVRWLSSFSCSEIGNSGRISYYLISLDSIIAYVIRSIWCVHNRTHRRGSKNHPKENSLISKI